MKYYLIITILFFVSNDLFFQETVTFNPDYLPNSIYNTSARYTSDVFVDNAFAKGFNSDQFEVFEELVQELQQEYGDSINNCLPFSMGYDFFGSGSIINGEEYPIDPNDTFNIQRMTFYGRKCRGNTFVDSVVDYPSSINDVNVFYNELAWLSGDINLTGAQMRLGESYTETLTDSMEVTWCMPLYHTRNLTYTLDEIFQDSAIFKYTETYTFYELGSETQVNSNYGGYGSGKFVYDRVDRLITDWNGSAEILIGFHFRNTDQVEALAKTTIKRKTRIRLE